MRAALRAALAAPEPLAPSLQRCALALATSLDGVLAVFWWRDGDELTRVAASRTDLPASLPLRVPYDGPGLGTILRAPRGPDEPAALDVAGADLLEGFTGFAGLPLLCGDGASGVLALHGHRSFAPEEIDLLAWAADLIAVALESRRIGGELTAALVGRNHDARQLAIAQEHAALHHDVAELLATATSFAEAAPALVRKLAERLDWEIGAVWHLTAPPNLRTVAVWHAPDRGLEALAAHLRTLVVPAENGLVSRVQRESEPVYVTDALDHDLPEDLPGGRSVRHALGFPIAGDAAVDGVFLFLSRVARPLDEDLVRVLATIGAQVGQYLRHKLVEEQLIQSQKMEAVGKLAGGVAHDFNNILTVITGYAAMSVEQVAPDHPLFDQSSEILSAAERAASLVNQLLAFSRKQVFHPRLIDLNLVVNDMERMLRRLIGEDIRLITRQTETPSMVRADLVHIEQVIVNLAVNARDAMPHGGQLFIEITHVDAEPPAREDDEARGPRPHVRLCVRDTGVGMTDEVRSHAFEPFFTTKEAGKGTGLGLATVYGIVRQNGGHVRVDSEPGRGAQFTIQFPRIVELTPAVATPGARAAAARGHETILLVEDEKAVRRLARNILKAAGYDVIEAGSGEEALNLCVKLERPLHLLITDMVMPGINGVELSRKLQASHAGVRILYISGYAEDSLFDGYAMSRGVPFLEKPFTPLGLAQKVRQVLDAPCLIAQ